MSKLDELMNEACGKKFKDCSLSDIKGKAKEFLDAMIIAHDEGSRRVSTIRVKKILEREFKINIGTGVVGKHLRKECISCAKKN